MKKLLILFILMIGLFSCRNEPIEVKNSDKVTTLELLKLADKDTTTYKVVYLNDVLYTINTDRKVVHRLHNYEGGFGTALIGLFAILIVLLIFMIIKI